MTTAADLDQHFIQTVGGLPGGPARPDGAAPVGAGSGLDGNTLLAIFDAQAQSRHLDFAARWMQQQGRGFYTISSANGAFGRHERHDSAGMRLVTAALRCRSSVRRSIAFVVRQAGQRTHRNQ